MGGNLMTAFGTPPFDVGQVVTSFAQDGFWLLDRLAPGTATHRIYRAYQVSGPLDLQALRAAWRTVVDRHDVLRTTLVEAGGELMQRVAARSSPSVSFVDLGHVSPADRDAHADRLSARAAAESIDLAVGPLARLTVFRLTTVDHRVVLVVHRAAADDSSVSILLQELSTYYARAVRPAGAVRRLRPMAARTGDRAGLPAPAGLVDLGVAATPATAGTAGRPGLPRRRAGAGRRRRVRLGRGPRPAAGRAVPSGTHDTLGRDARGVLVAAAPVQRRGPGGRWRAGGGTTRAVR